MPFLAAGAALGGLLGVGASTAGIITGAPGVLGLMGAGIGAAAGSVAQGSSDAKKAASAAQTAANNSKVDIAALDQQTRAIAERNARDAIALEQELSPETYNLRKGATEGLSRALGDTGASDTIRSSLMGQLASGGALDTPLLRAAIARAQEELAMGSDLPQDVRNQIQRQAAASGAGVGNIMQGRDIGLRDLGLNSLQIRQQRLQNASQLGGQEMALATNEKTNLFNTLQSLQQLDNNNFSKYLSAAQLGQSIPQPTVGLDPSAVANLSVANSNNQTNAALMAAQIKAAGAQGLTNLAGSLGTAGLLAFAK